MSKFFGLIIMSDLSLKRMWMNNAEALEILKNNQGCKIYRGSSDQEAVIVDDAIVWKDVQSVEKVG